MSWNGWMQGFGSISEFREKIAWKSEFMDLNIFWGGVSLERGLVLKRRFQ